MEQEGRIIDRDWSKYNGGYTVFRPKLMSPKALEEGYYWTYHQFYSMRSIFTRIAEPGLEMFYKLALNLAYKRMIRRFPKGELPEIAKLLHTVPSHFRQYLENFHQGLQFIELDEEF